MFASDNTAGIHPDVLAAMAAVNAGDALAYGDDPHTAAAAARFREHFGPDAKAYFVFSGTAANVLGLGAVLRPYEAVICAESAHVNVDECGAAERFIGCKLLTVPTADGKLRPADLDRHLHGFGDQHHAQPRAVSISQVTEYGTVYRPEEITALVAHAHRHGLVVHMDGARLANAAASLDVELRTITTDAGVDLLSFGGTKNGALAAEAVVFLDPALAGGFRYVRKQGMHLASKMRFVAAQCDALLSNDLWRRNATHANRMARRLADGVAGLARVAVTQPVEANAVFARLPREAIAPLQAQYFFHVWDDATGEVRWMTSFATQPEDVDAFVRCVRETVG